MGKEFSKEKKFDCICQYCDKDFKAADVKCKTCYECKQPRPCKCGCGYMVKTPGRYYGPGCQKRGKTYDEIYEADNPSNGFKSGEENLAKKPEIRKKISEGVKRSYDKELIETRRKQKLKELDNGTHTIFTAGKIVCENERGEKFRSKLEKEFAEKLYNNDIDYRREVCYKLRNKKRKIVDFVVGNNLIEISGAAYESWRKKFKERIKLLRNVTNEDIYIFTYNDKIKYFSDFEEQKSIIVDSINNTDKYIKKWCKL